jgi:hypothetical protein
VSCLQISSRQTPSCGIIGHSFLCPVSNDEHFQLSITEQTKPRLIKDEAGTMSSAATGTE